MLTIRQSTLAAVVAICGVSIPGSEPLAQDLGNGWAPTVIEIANLPKYCQDYFRKQVLPPNCDGVHHLCAGKVLINRFMNTSIPKPERIRIYGQAKKEVDYIFHRQNASCSMMGEARSTQNFLKTMEFMVR